MTDSDGVRAPRPPRLVTTAAGLLAVGAVALLVTWLLGAWVVEHVSSTRLWRVDVVVAPVVVAVGAAASAWVGTSALLAGACATVRSAGVVWRAGEVTVHRWAPGLVRRTLAVALATGIGLGTAVGAQATVAPPDAVTAVDLGWTPTSLESSTTAPGPDVDPEGPGTPTALPETPTDDAALDVDDTTAAGTSNAEPASPDALGAPGLPVAAPASPAGAGPTDPAPDHSPLAVTPAAAVPTQVPTTVPAQGPAAVAPHAAAAGTVVVEAGDTLWGLAARTLGPDASDAQIAAAWPRWYETNAATIGPDPDVLRPGQVLVVPGTGVGR